MCEQVMTANTIKIQDNMRRRLCKTYVVLRLQIVITQAHIQRRRRIADIRSAREVFALAKRKGMNSQGKNMGGGT